MTPIEIRHKATEATVAKFQTRAFRLGVVDCARMVAFHAKQMGWKVTLSKAGSYRTLIGAQAALRRVGYDNLRQAMDGHGISRIAPAAAMIGDVMEIQGDHPLGTLGICVGNGRIICFHESHPGTVIFQPSVPIAAWNMLP
jgi:hypothetical protein